MRHPDVGARRLAATGCIVSLFDRFNQASTGWTPAPGGTLGAPPTGGSVIARSQPILQGHDTSDNARQPIARSQPVLQPGHVTKLVAQADAIPQKTRSGGNLDGYLHLSSLIGICEREQTISQQHAVPSFNSVAGPMKIIWAIGRAVEKHIRNSVILARDRKNIYGKWACRCGGSTHLGEFPEGRTCVRCGGAIKHYREPLLVSHEHRVVGSPDITLIELGWYLAVEIKSMNKEQFDKLERPLADHIQQALGYRRLYKLMGFPVLDVVSVVYARKDFKFGGSRAVYKEWHVNALEYEGQIDAMFAAAKRVAQATAEGYLPARTCTTNTCARARECQRMSICFSL